MRLVFSSTKLRKQCNSYSEAKKLFHGDAGLAESLLARINALEEAATLKDIIVQPSFHFHKLQKKGRKNLEGFFAVDVKSRKAPWRIILQPLDDEERPFVPCNIDQIAGVVKIIEISEVSKHYE